MKTIFCENKTPEERLTITKRLIIFSASCILLWFILIAYELIVGANLSDNIGTYVCSLSTMICVLAINVRNQKELEEELNK